MQKPSLHWPAEPHWEFVTQVPQVPCTHACPPPHWLSDVHAPQALPMHASPVIPWLGPREAAKLQSAYVEHAPHLPATQPCPPEQSADDRQPPQVFEMHSSPAGQLAAVPQKQTADWYPCCDPKHPPSPPHSSSDMQAPHTLLTQT